MGEIPHDQPARDRFTRAWDVNLAVVANAGSGKTTAISERLAAIALSKAGSESLAHTAVVTYTNKAAAQIRQKARSVLLAEMGRREGGDLEALSRMDRVFFGTIHSFCLRLARQHGNTLGIHLNPTPVGDDEVHWQEFLEQDPMTFTWLEDAQTTAFLRHAPLDTIFGLAKGLDRRTEDHLRGRRPKSLPPPPPAGVLEEIRSAVPKRRGSGSDALLRNKEAAERWAEEFRSGTGRLPMPSPEGSAAGIEDLFGRLVAPLKEWLAQAGGALASELSRRYREWREDRGVQTYADQIESALAVLENRPLLEGIRGEGWHVILDEAQDTDPKQFAVLVEITRPVGADPGTWPGRGGAAPLPGRFCMVGDAQQGIYSDRADIENFKRHVEAFTTGEGGERLTFGVTFRNPVRVVSLLNRTLPASFGRERDFNFALPPADGAPAPFRQVAYEPLVAGPGNPEGAAWRLPVPPFPAAKASVDARLAHEARHLARVLSSGGPGAVGAADWGDICILAPRTKWLPIIRDELEAAGIRTALQIRNRRNGDNPVYAWLCGLLAVCCDPENAFEWVGVLREVFAVSDAVISRSLGSSRSIRWDETEGHPAPVAGALAVLRPFVSRVDSGGEQLMVFASELTAACGLRERARLVDPDGALEDELSRLLARAAILGQEGAGPREWLSELLAGIDEERASGRPARDAISLISCHSAKGLEWPVVVPVGLWRSLRHPDTSVLKLVEGPDGERRVVFDNDGLGPEAVELRKRGRLREQVRLLYVTLTRARNALVIPVSPDKPEGGSFLDLWGLDPTLLQPMPEVAPRPLEPGAAPIAEAGPAPTARTPQWEGGEPAPSLPGRVLPHQLASHADAARSALHEASLDTPGATKDTLDPLEYGVWWHETLEFVPWAADTERVEKHGLAALALAAGLGFRERAREEWERLLASTAWAVMREPRWTRLAEVGIFAPWSAEKWIDGVIDLVLHDPTAGEVWIVDWKTNRRIKGEDDDALMRRLSDEYRSQLSAYGLCASPFFPGCRTRLWLYSTVTGTWTELGSPG